MNRRHFIHKSLLITTGFLTGILVSFKALAVWPRTAFNKESLDEALQELFGDSEAHESDRIQIDMHELAENGAVVPVKVITDIENIKSISILAEKNPVPLVASYTFAPAMVGYIATRIKLAETTRVMAYVKTDDALYTTSKMIEVTEGGCGA